MMTIEMALRIAYTILIVAGLGMVMFVLSSSLAGPEADSKSLRYQEPRLHPEARLPDSGSTVL